MELIVIGVIIYFLVKHSASKKEERENQLKEEYFKQQGTYEGYTEFYEQKQKKEQTQQMKNIAGREAVKAVGRNQSAIVKAISEIIKHM